MKRIRTRVFVQILIPTVILFFVIVVGGLYFVNRSYEKQVIAQKNNELSKAARAIDNWLIARISHMLQLSRTPLIRNGQEEEIRGFLREELGRFAFIYSRLFYVYLDGRYWDTAGNEGIFHTNVLLHEFAARDKLFYYEGPVLDHPVFDPSILIAVPVFSKNNNEMKAILASTIPLPTFKRVIGYFTLEEFKSFTLVNPKSIIINSTEDNLIGRLEDDVYGTEFSSYTMYKKNMVFVSVLRTTWKIVAFVPSAEALLPIRQINKIVAVFFIIVVLLIGSVSLIISNAVVRPIQQLTEGVHGIMEGNYRQKVEVTTRDELSELANAFNRLSERMVKLRTDDQFSFLGHFAARMAHEMRKPLHIAQLAVQALKSKGTYNNKYVQMIQTEIANTDQFIGEILNFARPEKLNLSRYSLSELLEKIIKKYQFVAAEKEIIIKDKIDRSIKPFYFDIIRMEEVISNLLQNAVEAVDGQKGERIITVRLTKKDNEIRLVITDSGPGFNEKLLDRVIDPYFTTKHGGTGLGLAICYRILKAHGADLRLGNTEDGNGKVEVVYPL
ncbi:MAG: hypothetical protein DRP87_06275 [Spirochaetes bacterium]|nr:MAG: hypothetical protein DRP87_06275 [Spirochaetota bacterium]